MIPLILQYFVRPTRAALTSRLPINAAATALALVLSQGVLDGQHVIDYGGYRPHYQGYGVNTPGGRGGVVCRVTSLSDDGWPPVQGTLRYCVEASTGPRFVIFEISGTIRLLNGPLFVRNPFITIAGQTAPSPGILIRGPGVIIDTHDVVTQHLRIRVWNLPSEPHALWIRDGARDVVIDHVSLSWSVWTSVGIYSTDTRYSPGDITIVDSLVAESLACSGVNIYVPCDPVWYPTSGFANSRAMLIRNAGGVTLLRNGFAHNNDRQPETGGPTRTILVNNMIYNPSLTPLAAVLFADPYHEGATFSVLKSNILIPGPTTPGYNGYIPPEYKEAGEVKLVRVDPSLNPESRIYLDDNYYDKDCDGSACLASPAAQWILAKDYVAEAIGLSVHALAPPLELPNLPLASALPHTQVEAYVIANAGARPLDRDTVDRRIIHEIATRSGSVPNNPSEKAGPGTSPDGFPILAVNRRPLTVPTNPNARADNAGRTRIEAWLETFARELEPTRNSQ
jgi:hypothetical protein